jgi:hypothetical protein
MARTINSEAIKSRTKQFALIVLCRARSTADFTSKLGLVLEKQTKRSFGWNS